MKSPSAVSTPSAVRSSLPASGSFTTVASLPGRPLMAVVFSREEATMLLTELRSRPWPHADAAYLLMRGVVERLERGVEAIDADQDR